MDADPIGSSSHGAKPLLCLLPRGTSRGIVGYACSRGSRARRRRRFTSAFVAAAANQAPGCRKDQSSSPADGGRAAGCGTEAATLAGAVPTAWSHYRHPLAIALIAPSRACIATDRRAGAASDGVRDRPISRVRLPRSARSLLQSWLEPRTIAMATYEQSTGAVADARSATRGGARSHSDEAGISATEESRCRTDRNAAVVRGVPTGGDRISDSPAT